MILKSSNTVTNCPYSTYNGTVLICTVKKRTKQILLLRLNHHTFFNSLGQMRRILGDKVGQLAVFAVVPDLLIRIQLRGICRKPFHLDTATKPVFQVTHSAAMDHPPANHKNDAVGEMPQNPRHKYCGVRPKNTTPDDGVSTSTSRSR